MYITFDEVMSFKREIDELKAELDKVRKGNIDTILTMNVDNEKLQAELQAVNDDYNNDHKVHNEYEKGLLKEINELKAEIKSYIKAREGRINTIDELKADIKEKEKQYHMLASSKSSHYPKEYKLEAEDYFSLNPKAKYVAFYMLSEYDVRDGEGGDLMLYKDDAIIIIDNNERSD